MTTGELPTGRYGTRDSGHRTRWARPLVMVLGALVGLAVAVVAYHNLAQNPLQTQVLGFDVQAGQPDANAVSLQFSVIRDDPSRPAVCIVRARSYDGQETGRREVYVPPAAGPVGLTTVIQTSRPSVTADVYGCSLQVPAYLVPHSGSR
ncbi:MAG: DUF4307 domain-containing protein [Pseudonocardiaceae bacterium]